LSDDRDDPEHDGVPRAVPLRTRSEIRGVLLLGEWPHASNLG